MSDVVTIYKNNGPVNKQVLLNQDGNVEKKPAGVITTASAFCVHVPDQATMLKVLENLADKENCTMGMGYFPGSEPKKDESQGESFRVVSQNYLKDLLGLNADVECPTGWHEVEDSDGVPHRYITRTKQNMAYGSWMLNDYDVVKGMPDDLIYESYSQWVDAMATVVPGFDTVGKIIVPSTSGRVLLDGAPAFPNSSGFHCYSQVEDPEDITRFGRSLLMATIGTELGFKKPIFRHDTGEQCGESDWTIADPTVYSCERLIYDGKPHVTDDRLSVADPVFEIFEGSRLNTSKLELSEEDRERIESATGFKLTKEQRSGRMMPVLVNSTKLKLDTAIKSKKHGVLTVEDYWSSNYGKLRSQTAFRDSSSWNGYLNRHKDGSPFHYDNGTHQKFVLSDELKVDYHFNRAMVWVESADVSEIKSNWLEYAKPLKDEDVELEELRQAVGKRAKLSLKVLTKMLKKAVKQWNSEANNIESRERKQQVKDSGKSAIEWQSENKLPDLMPLVQAALTKHTDAGHIFTVGGRLTRVVMEQPSAVRAIYSKHLQGDEYEEMLLSRPFVLPTLLERFLKSVYLYTVSESGRISHIETPRIILQHLMADSNFAPPLSGLVEAPSVMPNGVLMDKAGYYPETGAYAAFGDGMTTHINRNPTASDALDAVRYLKKELFKDFPFEEVGDQDAALAFLLTAFVRVFIGKAPGFMVTASDQSSGKSTLVDVVFHSAYGRAAAACNWEDSKTEMAKQIIAFLLEGHTGINFDNLPRGMKVDHVEVAKLMTQDSYQGRVLGANEMATLPTNVTISLTGNRLTPVGDMLTRLIPIRLNPRVERPECRAFSRPNIDEWAMQNRPQVVGAVCTLLLAWLQLGKTAEIDITPSRFPEWDAAVRKPLIWAGCSDVIEQLSINREDDPRTNQETAFLECWYRLFGSEPIALSQIASGDSNLTFGIVRNDGDVDKEDLGKRHDFSEATNTLFDGWPDARYLGNKLRFFVGAVRGGYILTKHKVARSVENTGHLWSVQRILTDGAASNLGFAVDLARDERDSLQSCSHYPPIYSQQNEKCSNSSKKGNVEYLENMDREKGSYDCMTAESIGHCSICGNFPWCSSADTHQQCPDGLEFINDQIESVLE